mmetsp:Transcript_78714/g.228484  ORF Transcript_78714/g.228484 Transcript_78714/m.228484 type:complete len:227 (-) Transcript_78714:121-801(-)
MPQAKASRRLGIAMDHGLTTQPAPVNLNMAKVPSRDYRAAIRDHSNALLAQPVIDNSLHERHWQGKGFPGHVQFMTYVGREPLRPGVKLERDIQVSQMPLENWKPLNVTAMGRSADRLAASPTSPSEQQSAHDEAVASMRSFRAVATQSERFDNGHWHHRREVEHHDFRQRLLAEQAKALSGLRTAGTTSTNPRMGTCGSLPELKGLRGPEGNAAWRASTPWATDD